ncbi:pyruvate kinase [Micromonospora sp. M12]
MGRSPTTGRVPAQRGGQRARHVGQGRRGPALSLSLGVDLVALSFVRSAEDIKLVHNIMAEEGVFRPVLAKVEKPEAVEHLEAIVLAFDGVMVARGDLGVEMPLDEVPLVQKRAVQLCRENASRSSSPPRCSTP